MGANPPDFTLKLDRSDAKITLANIQKAKCLTHATWEIPKTPDEVSGHLHDPDRAAVSVDEINAAVAARFREKAH